jgi:hypothetical protein
MVVKASESLWRTTAFVINQCVTFRNSLRHCDNTIFPALGLAWVSAQKLWIPTCRQV